MNILVLGATSDIARAFVGRLATANDHVVLAARNAQELATIAGDLQIRTQAKISTLPFDAADPTRCAAMAAETAALVGKIDGVILAFGYLGEQTRAQSSAEEATQIIHLNYTAAVQVLEPIAALLEQQKSGWIFGLSSVAGVRGRKSNYLYGSAKGAFTLYLEGLAHRLAASGVSVKIAKLGFCASKMTRGMTMPGWAVATPDQVARGLCWLLRSPLQAAYVPWRWWPIMTLIRALPARIFNRSNL